MTSQYTNNLEVSISDVARIKFYEVHDSERSLVVNVSMGLELLEGLSKTILQTIEQHKKVVETK